MPFPGAHRTTTQAHLPGQRLTVWPYTPAGSRARQRTATASPLPLDLAGQIVHRLSTPGAVVVDLDGGTAVATIAAASLGRRGIGVAPDLHQARIAATNLEVYLDPEQRLLAEIRVSSTGAPTDALTDLAGTVDLIIANLATTPGDGHTTPRRAPRAGVGTLIAGQTLLRPGGVLAVVTGAQWAGQPPSDPGDAIGQHLTAAGLLLRQRVLAQSIGKPPGWACACDGSELRGLGLTLVHHSLLVFARRGAARG